MTARYIEALVAPSGKRHLEVYDEGFSGGSFGVRVSRQTGSKTFFCRVTLPDGRRTRLTLGDFPGLGLAPARANARKAVVEAQAGRSLADEERKYRSAPTFADLAQAYLGSPGFLRRRERTRLEYARIIQKEILPSWGKLKAADVGRRHVSEVLDGVMVRGPIMANRVRGVMSVLFDFGCEREFNDENPALRVKKPAPERKRNRYLGDEQIPAFWAACEREGLVVGSLFKFLLLTGQRSGETCMAERSEISGDVWTIPEEHTKNGRPHSVPLSPQALRVLDPLLELGGDWLWPSPVLPGAPIRFLDKAAGRLSQRCGFRFSPHDLRRTLTTGLGNMGTSRDTLALILNHVLQGPLGHYDLAPRTEAVRRALFSWGAKVEALAAGRPLKVARIG
ncbi:MAG: tyrosine-type recombinase/integrase [Acidobacteriota bacterium]